MKHKIRLLCAFLLIACVIFVAYRLHLVEEMKPLKEGISAFKNENYAEALKKLKPAAEGGDLIARSYIAQMYALGLGLEANEDLAKKWLSCEGIKNCDSGQPEYSFAYIFTNKDDSYYDIQKAKFWMKISADKGYKKATVWLEKNQATSE